jgi:Fe2+ transport system protein FeoA
MGVFVLKAGESGIIKKMDLRDAQMARLVSLGINVGSKITVVSYSLFNTSVLILSGFIRVAMRKSIAQKIEVERCR